MEEDKVTSEPIWTEELKNRKVGATTLKQCGWCQHRGSGSYRHDCMLEGSCSLMPSYGEERDVKWDTPCVIITKGKEDLENYIKSHACEIEEAKGNIKREEEIINNLKMLIKEARDIPPLPWNRKHNHFNLKDRVSIYLERERIWKFGTVVYGYRNHDGMVSFHIDETPEPIYEYLPVHKMEPGEYPGGYINPEMAEKMTKEHEDLAKKIGKLANAPGCGISVPTVMLKSEYDFFVDNPKDWKRWITLACSKYYNGERTEAPRIKNYHV